MKKIVPINWTDKVGLNIKTATNAIIDHFVTIDNEIGKEFDKTRRDASKTISINFDPSRYV